MRAFEEIAFVFVMAVILFAVAWVVWSAIITLAAVAALYWWVLA